MSYARRFIIIIIIIVIIIIIHDYYYYAFIAFFNSVLSAVIFTGTILKDAFNSLSNLDNAKFSAGETHQYLSENPKINSDGGDDIIPVSMYCTIMCMAIY